jgi:hypothetical protein
MPKLRVLVPHNLMGRLVLGRVVPANLNHALILRVMIIRHAILNRLLAQLMDLFVHLCKLVQTLLFRQPVLQELMVHVCGLMVNVIDTLNVQILPFLHILNVILFMLNALQMESIVLLLQHVLKHQRLVVLQE